MISRQTDSICYALIANGNGINVDTLGRDMAYAITDWGAGTPLQVRWMGITMVPIVYGWAGPGA